MKFSKLIWSFERLFAWPSSSWWLSKNFLGHMRYSFIHYMHVFLQCVCVCESLTLVCVCMWECKCVCSSMLTISNRWDYMCFSLFKCKLNLLAVAAEQRPNHSTHTHTHKHTHINRVDVNCRCLCLCLLFAWTIKENCVQILRKVEKKKLY